MKQEVIAVELCRNSYLIMAYMHKFKALHKARGLTIDEINAKVETVKSNTMHKKIKILESAGFIKQGVKSGRAKTYYLTESGVSEIPEDMRTNHNKVRR